MAKLKNAAFLRSQLRIKIIGICFLMFLFWPNSSLHGQVEQQKFLLQGTFYQDWLGYSSTGANFNSQLSSRLKLTYGQKQGEGWTFRIDARNRYFLREHGSDRFSLYDIKLSYDKASSPLFFSLGQMNLYDTAGVGELLGFSGGYKINKDFFIGGYAGYKMNYYNQDFTFQHQKIGAYFRYIGSKARQLSSSLNMTRFSGQTERLFIHSRGLLPLSNWLVLYGNIEYELGNHIKNEDRLARIFFNARLNLSRFIDFTANYSSGKGLDYEQYLLAKSKDPSLSDGTIERFYYNEMAGIRLSLKPGKDWRFHFSLRRSEQKDMGIQNNSLQLGLSSFNLLKTGLSVYGNYNFNRGDRSESDSMYLSISKSFGRMSVNMSYSNTFNSIRIDGSGSSTLFHIPDRHTLSSDLFFVISKTVAVSVEHVLVFQTDTTDHIFSVRLILKK